MKRRKRYNNTILDMFLESIENDEDEIVKEDEEEEKESSEKDSEGSDESESDEKEVVADDDSEEVEEGESFEIGDNPEDQKQIEEAQYSRRHYNSIVDVIVNASDKIAAELGKDGQSGKIKEILAGEFVDIFKADNPRFDSDRFMNAIAD